MKISVIIPFYNAAAFIEKSVRSALHQKQVAEIILVNDGSSDNSLDVIRFIKDERIVLLHHEGNINKGRSASRNLGIQAATSEYIAFLDADDFYLENRFENEWRIFNTIKNCDGVYNAIGVHFYRESSAAEEERLSITSLKELVDSRELGDTLVRGHKGYFHLIGATFKKDLIDKIGYFNEQLEVAEDTEWLWKAAYLGTLLPGNITHPVSLRGVHGTNSFNNEDLYDIAYVQLFHLMYRWSLDQKLPLTTIELFFERIMILEYNNKHSILYYFNLWWNCITYNYRSTFSYLAIKYFPLVYKKKSLKAKLYARK
jgi:glycosyltransferase involved in cell wall biosynthesis